MQYFLVTIHRFRVQGFPLKAGFRVREKTEIALQKDS